MVKWHSRKGIVTYFGRLTWVPFQYQGPGRYVPFCYALEVRAPPQGEGGCFPHPVLHGPVWVSRD